MKTNLKLIFVFFLLTLSFWGKANCYESAGGSYYFEAYGRKIYFSSIVNCNVQKMNTLYFADNVQEKASVCGCHVFIPAYSMTPVVLFSGITQHAEVRCYDVDTQNQETTDSLNEGFGLVTAADALGQIPTAQDTGTIGDCSVRAFRLHQEYIQSLDLKTDENGIIISEEVGNEEESQEDTEEASYIVEEPNYTQEQIRRFKNRESLNLKTACERANGELPKSISILKSYECRCYNNGASVINPYYDNCPNDTGSDTSRKKNRK